LFWRGFVFTARSWVEGQSVALSVWSCSLFELKDYEDIKMRDAGEKGKNKEK